MLSKTLHPIKLIVEGFWSMKERTEFIFPDKGPVLIAGKWKGSDISSGSGKSIIPRAIRFNLGFSETPATELKNWDSKKLYTAFTLTNGTDIYEVIRDPKLSLVINGEIYGSDGKALSKSAEEKLQEILGAPIDIVSVLVNRTQREYGMFLNATDAENKEFLTPLLKLAECEVASELWESEITNINMQLSLLQNEKTITEQNLAMNVEITNEQMKKACDEYDGAVAHYNTLCVTSVDPKIGEEVALIDQELYKIDRVKNDVSGAKAQNAMIRSTVERVTQDIEILKKQICAMCKREWDQSKATLEEKRLQVEKLLQNMKTNSIMIENSEPIIAVEPKLRERRNELTNKVAAMNASLEPTRARVSSARDYARSLKDQMVTRESAKARLVQIAEKIKSFDELLEVKTHANAMIGRQGFQGSIFDEVLQGIETKTNRMIAKIPNMNGITLRISSTSVTAKGKAKKTISKQVFKFGKQMGLRNLSGGQQCALELCIDMAVRAEVMSRSGLRLGWVSLDESLTGLDAETSKYMLEVLRSEVDGLILVVDHATEVKEGFEKIINIEYNGRESYVAPN